MTDGNPVKFCKDTFLMYVPAQALLSVSAGVVETFQLYSTTEVV